MDWFLQFGGLASIFSMHPLQFLVPLLLRDMPVHDELLGVYACSTDGECPAACTLHAMVSQLPACSCETASFDAFFQAAVAAA